MPIITKRLSEGIYHHRWIGHVSMDDVLEAVDVEKQLLKEDTIDKYIVILDGTEVKTIPLNISKLLSINTGDELFSFIYNAPPIGQQVGHIISSLTKTKVIFTNDWDDIITKANQMITEHKATTIVE